MASSAASRGLPERPRARSSVVRASSACTVKPRIVTLTRLAATGRHDRKCQVVNLRFFVGLTIEQTAELLGLSPASVKRDWDYAKAWISREIQREERR